MADAFRFHLDLGKDDVAQRTHALNRQLKEDLSRMDHVALKTPVSEELPAGITCFDVDGRSPDGAVDHLARRRIVATMTPYATPFPRLTPSIYNTPDEIDAVLEAVADLG